MKHHKFITLVILFCSLSLVAMQEPLDTIKRSSTEVANLNNLHCHSDDCEHLSEKAMLAHEKKHLELLHRHGLLDEHQEALQKYQEDQKQQEKTKRNKLQEKYLSLKQAQTTEEITNTLQSLQSCNLKNITLIIFAECPKQALILLENEGRTISPVDKTRLQEQCTIQDNKNKSDELTSQFKKIFKN